MRKGRRRYVIAWAAIAGILAVSALTAVAYLLPYDNVSASSWTVSDTTVEQGQTIFLTNTFCSDGTPWQSERFVSRPGVARAVGVTEFSPPVSDVTGCRPAKVAFTVPEDVPPGVWHALYRTTYQANPIREITFETVSEPFTVTERTTP